MDMARLTIKQIAKIAGVSPSAVSIVLNDKKGVSDQTRIKIKDIVEKFNYIPNQNSRRLLFNKTDNIAILSKKTMSPLDRLFQAELINVILHECENRGFNLMFASYIKDVGKTSFPDAIKSHDVDGVIFISDIDPSIIDDLNAYEIPSVIADSHTENVQTGCFLADYYEAAYTAINYLIGLGHKAIAYLGASADKTYEAQTFTGYKIALEENGIEIPLNWIQMDSYDEASACECMNRILSFDRIPSSLFCASDICAIGAMRCIKEYGLRIPDDISVIGIDDIILSSFVEPSLTTIKIDKKKIGRLAVEMIIDRIKKEKSENIKISSNELIIRNSTKKFA